jgi:hypothetical protein
VIAALDAPRRSPRFLVTETPAETSAMIATTIRTSKSVTPRRAYACVRFGISHLVDYQQAACRAKTAREKF